MPLFDIEKLLEARSSNSYQEASLVALQLIKQDAVLRNDQSLATYIWCLERIYCIKKQFIEAFCLMRNKEYYKAWCSYDRCEIELCFLKKHFDYKDNKFDLLFIEQQVAKFQALFPYNIFMSRESIETDFTCSICGAKIGIRKSECNHVVGQIYNGEMCCRQINNVKLLGIAFVRNPVDKFSVPMIEGVDYNYEILEGLLGKLKSPFDEWDYEVLERKWDYKEDEAYRDVGRNDTCPCGSGKKFKKCCYLNQGVVVKHIRIKIKKEMNPSENIPFRTIKTKIRRIANTQY